MSPSSRRVSLWLLVLGLWLGASTGLLRGWFGHFADPVGLVIRGTIVLTWTGLAWGTMRSWWTEYRQRGGVHQQLSGSRKWHAPMLVVTTGLALLIMADVHSERWDLAVAAAVVVPFLAGEFWEQWREGRAQEATWRAQVRARHERAIAADAGIALPRRIAKLRPDLVRQCPACAEMYALWYANRKISFTQAESIIERQIVLGLCPPHAAWRDE